MAKRTAGTRADARRCRDSSLTVPLAASPHSGWKETDTALKSRWKNCTLGRGQRKVRASAAHGNQQPLKNKRKQLVRGCCPQGGWAWKAALWQCPLCGRAAPPQQATSNPPRIDHSDLHFPSLSEMGISFPVEVLGLSSVYSCTQRPQLQCISQTSG